MAPAAVADDLMRAFSADASTISMLSAIYYYVYTLMQIPSGILSDKIGVKKIITIGNIVAGIGTIIFSVSHLVVYAYLGRFIIGLGVSVIFVGFMKNNSTWFEAKMYSLISGLTVLIGNIGSVIASGPLVEILHLYKWRVVFLWLGFLSIILGALSYLFVKEGEYYNGESVSGIWRINDSQMHGYHNIESIIRNKDIRISAIINFGIVGSYFAFIGLWSVPYIMDVYKIVRDEAIIYNTVSLIAFAIGAFCIGYVSDYLKKRRIILIIGSGIYMCVWICMMLFGHASNVMVLLYYTLLGVSSSTAVLTYTISKESVERDCTGLAISIVNVGLFLGAAIIQSIIGFTLDHSWKGGLRDGIRMYDENAYICSIYYIIVFAV
ncbi:MAG: MFS transporter, partial [Bacteroidetes bacterium]|nr:MFS transporter [Bacteroidota bacterium]